MRAEMRFEKDGLKLFAFGFPLDDKEKIGEFMSLGYEEFRKAHPDVDLMDGVNVTFDRG